MNEDDAVIGGFVVSAQAVSGSGIFVVPPIPGPPAEKVPAERSLGSDYGVRRRKDKLVLPRRRG